MATAIRLGMSEREFMRTSNIARVASSPASAYTQCVGKWKSEATANLPATRELLAGVREITARASNQIEVDDRICKRRIRSRPDGSAVHLPEAVQGGGDLHRVVFPFPFNGLESDTFVIELVATCGVDPEPHSAPATWRS